MSEPIVTTGGGWRPPSNLREGLAAGGALVIVFGLIQVAAPFAAKITFIQDTIRDKVVGTLFALYFPIERSINRVMIVTQGGEAHVRPDLSPWFVTGITAAVLLFAWNQFVGYLGGAAIGAAIGELSKTMSLSHANVGQAIRVGATVLSIPLCAVASIYAGMALNRSTRSGVVFALLLASIGYLGLNVFMTWIFQRDTIVEMLHETTDQQQMLGFAVGLALIAFVVFVFGAIGVIVSRVRRERSMGRLVSAARRLAPDDRDAVTEDVMNRLQGRAG